MLELEMGSGGGARAAVAAAGVGADGDVIIHMGRLLLAGKRLGGPLVVVW